MPEYKIPLYDDATRLSLAADALAGVRAAEQTVDDWARRRARWLLSTMGAVDKFTGRLEPRREQLRPPGDPFIWLCLGGRGSGKTRPGAEEASEFARQHAGSLLGFAAPKFAKFRDIQMEGESGLLNILPPSAMKGGSISSSWNRSLGEFTFANGSIVKGFSAEKPGEPRGYNLWFAWCDEPAEFADAHLGLTRNSTFANLLLALRAPEDGSPYMVVTGTPTNSALITELLAMEQCAWVRYSMYRNAANLSESWVRMMTEIYEGTTLGLQELHAEILDEVEGALWTSGEIEADRVTHHLDDDGAMVLDLPPFRTKVVGVDPSLGGEAGIVVCGVDGSPVPVGYILDDRSIVGRGAIWAAAAVQAYHDHGCSAMVIETNLPPKAETIATVRSVPGGETVRIVDVTAHDGKAARAGPVKALSQQHRIKWGPSLGRLEAQCKTWVPPDGIEPSKWSPNRLDAMVWAFYYLMVRTAQHGARIGRSGAHIQLPSPVRG